MPSETINPYAPPETRGPKAEPLRFREMNLGQLRQLVRDDKGISSFAKLLLLAAGCCFIGIALLHNRLDEHWLAYLPALPGAWMVGNYAGLIARQNYGRDMTKLSCIILFPLVPIGTFIAFLGWSLTKRTGHHFGQGRVIIQRVKREIKHRRKHGLT